MWCVYIIRSIEFPDEEYIGATEDLKRRLPEHNAGKSAHTAKFKPWKLGRTRQSLLEKAALLAPYSPITAFNRSLKATISSFIATSSDTEQSDAARIDCGTLRALSFSAWPCGVSAMST